jgi:hypothetical protein
MWPARARAAQLTHYRSSRKGFDVAAQDEALELLAPSYSYDQLLRASPRHIPRGTKLTWTKLAAGVADALAHDLTALHDAAGLEAVSERASLLAERLQQRDDVKGARVTTQVRDRIRLVCMTTATLVHLVAVGAGKREPSEGSAHDALSLRHRWRKLGGSGDAWARGVVERAVGRALTSGVAGSVKSLFTKALEHWTPSANVVHERGERIEWDK